MTKSRITVILQLGIVLFVVSCSTPLKEVIYLNDIVTNKTHSVGPVPIEYLIRPNDQLYIKVISDDPLNAVFLNMTGIQGPTSMGNTNNGLELITYLVNEEGEISYPQLGELKVEKMTTSMVKDIIQKEVDEYLEGASVIVKLVNRNITVLGEVNSPGQQLMVKNKLTIFEALGTAGDITDWGNRKNVKVIREIPEGKHVVELDLTTPAVLHSPYYYILPQDVIYVEHRSKLYGAKNMSYAAPISIATSVMSLAVLLLTLLQ